jgi:membrane-associated phospholipid phosphatase
MISKYLFVLIIFSLVLQNTVCGQKTLTDTTKTAVFSVSRLKPLIIPTILIGYGWIGLDNHYLISYDHEIKEEMTEDIDRKVTIDDFSQYVPFVSVYAINALGIKGKNKFRDRTVILATAYLIMASTVLSLKSVSNVERPDKTSWNSFPSGHTATAFMGAEFLWQEYKDVSVWYGIAGYTVAAGTGFFRMYNNRHWLTDVAAGAGIGMLSTKIAYWVNPYITKNLFTKHKHHSSAILYPYYNGKQTGIGIAMNF